MDVARWAELARQVLTARGVKGETEVSLLFVDEDAIAAPQRAVPGQERPDRRAVVPDRGRAGADRALARLRRERARAPRPRRARSPCSATS